MEDGIRNQKYLIHNLRIWTNRLINKIGRHTSKL